MNTEITWLKFGGAVALLAMLWLAIGRSPTPEPELSQRKPDNLVVPDTAPRPLAEIGPTDDMRRKPAPVLGDRLDAKASARPRPVYRKLNRRRPSELAADPQFHKLLEIDSARKMALLQKDPEELRRVRRELLAEGAIPRRVIEAALLDSNAEVRLAALYEISLGSEDPPLDLLAPVLQGDPSAEVRLEALTIIADSDDEEADALIRSSLDDADETVRSEAHEEIEARSDDLL